MLDVEAVRQKIEEQGRTRKWLAEYCGIKVPSFNHILSGRTQPGMPVLKLLAQALGCDPDDLTKGRKRAG